MGRRVRVSAEEYQLRRKLRLGLEYEDLLFLWGEEQALKFAEIFGTSMELLVNAPAPKTPCTCRPCRYNEYLKHLRQMETAYAPPTEEVA